MQNVLLVTSSPRGEASFSTTVANELVSQLADAKVSTRDLWREPLPHIDPDFIHGIFTPEEARSPAQRKAAEISDKLIEELFAADTIVIAAGMINFSIPSTLKAWLDYVVRSGKTFRYGENGPEGLVIGKKVILVLSKGGIYSTEPMAGMDYMEPFLRSALGFIGLTDIETVVIEGVAFGSEAAEKAVAEAKVKASTVAAAYA